MRRLITVFLAVLGACAPLAVHDLKPDEFMKYRVPRRIVVFKGNNSPQTAAVADAIDDTFAAAGFAVVSTTEAAKCLGRENVTPEDLVARNCFTPLCATAGIDGVVLVRQFYGTELQLIDARTGNVKASGCWRTSYINIVNDVIDQLKNNKINPRLCPVPLLQK